MTGNRRRGALALCSLAAVMAAVSLGAGGAEAGPGNVVALTKEQKSALLTAAADLHYPPDATYHRGLDTIRAVAAPLAEAVPLPDGGNFNGIRWSEVEGVHVDDILFTLQYNASCQWYRALSDGRETATARTVLSQMASWPAFRDQPTAELARQLAAADVDSEPFQLKLAECGAQHRREVAFASAHGLVPPR